MIKISNRALERVKFLLNNRGKDSAGIRVKVKSGGCSGLSYVIEYADSITEFDEVINASDVKILVDTRALIYLIGSEMDFVEEKFKSGFVFNNPNQKGSCGCGESFHV